MGVKDFDARRLDRHVERTLVGSAEGDHVLIAHLARYRRERMVEGHEARAFEERLAARLVREPGERALPVEYGSARLAESAGRVREDAPDRNPLALGLGDRAIKVEIVTRRR